MLSQNRPMRLNILNDVFHLCVIKYWVLILNKY